MTDPGSGTDGLNNTKIGRVFSGLLGNLPPVGSKIVRIFTSSTFTDTKLERNSLMENVYPKLKEFCREKHGLEFQVVDMRWGIRDEATDDHMTTELCMQEIDNCQRLSMGPNFVVFLGQKYGYRPMPAKILAAEFETICEVASNVASELELLQTWYKKDTNVIPAVYILQPVSSILTNYNNKRHIRLMEADQYMWDEIMGKICRTLRKCAYAIHLAKKLDKEGLHSYFMSVTEREVERGILQQENTADHCIAFIRKIQNVNMGVTAFRYTSKFMDFIGKNLDEDATKYLQSLRDERLPKKLPASNQVHFEVEWQGKEGIEEDTHKDYLKTFCEEFYNRITELVDRAVVKHEMLSSDTVFSETLQHLHACERFCAMFQGREEIVDRVQGYVVGESRQPLVLFGESGCGKTSLLAKSASMVFNWLDTSKPIMVLRFLGTSPDSSTLMPLLTSICQQISYIFDQPREEIPDELSPLCQYFKKLLSFATAERPLILYLDSLDQLSGADGAHKLAWLPTLLPENVKIIVSTLPNYYGLLETLKDKITEEQNFVQVFPLGPDLGGAILKSWLKNAKRQITDGQWVVVNEAIAKCNLPLFVRLVYDEICRWRSYSTPAQTQLAFTIHDIIMKLFDRIEIQHGRTLVSRAFGYITASKSGISEAELEDLLSLDENVLNDVYQYHIPPARRIPPLLWTRIRNDLPGYLSERQADGINVIDWYHRQFIDASRERYFRNLNFASEMHSNLCEFYLGTYAGIPKPFEYTEQQRQRFRLEDRHGESDRKVPIQPLVFHNAKGDITRYNLRKLNELPFHLIRSARYDDLYDKVLFDYKWLHAKLSCMPLQAVMSDFEDAIDYIKDKDIKLVADAIRLSSSVLMQNPSMLGPQIVGRLLPYYTRNKKINSLIKQCETDGLENCALVPAHHCLHTPGGPLQYSLEGHHLAPFGVAITSDAKYLVSASNKFIIWDLTTSDVSRIINPGIEGIMQTLVISKNDKYAVTFTNINQILICNLSTGEHKRIDKPLEGKDPILGISTTTSNFTVWSKSEWCSYSMEGTLVKRIAGSPKTPIVSMDVKTDDDVYVITSNGDQSGTEMTLQAANCGTTPAFDFHSCLALNKRHDLMLCNIGISDNNVVMYRHQNNVWQLERSFNNTDTILGLTLSPDGGYVIATKYTGYTIWDLNDSLHQKSNTLVLPDGIRNIPQKNKLANQLVTFTKNNKYVIAGVRKNLYVWNVKTAELYKTLDAHFGRIIALASIIQGDYNVVVSSSLDKSIKVWNVDNITENVNAIQRMEKAIETISIAANTYIGVAVARNCLGIWNLQTGKLKCTLAHTGTSAIVTHALITADGGYVVSVESGNVLIWNVEKEIMVNLHNDGDVHALFLTEMESKYIAVVKTATNVARIVCRTIPDGQDIFKFEYQYTGMLKKPVLTKDGLFMIVPGNDSKGHDVLRQHHAKTGTHMYDVPLKCNNYRDYQRLVAMPHDANLVATIDIEKGNIWDVKKKCFVRSVPRWNGECMNNGRFGLHASNRGGFEIIELKHGHTVTTLLHKAAEGVHSVKTCFTKNDRHVLHYHSGHRSVRVFRVVDGKCIANYRAHAELKDMVGTEGGASVVLCAIDGSVTTLTIADPADEYGKEVLQNLRNGMPLFSSPEQSPSKSKLAMEAPEPTQEPGHGPTTHRASIVSGIPKSLQDELRSLQSPTTISGESLEDSSRSPTPLSVDSLPKHPKLQQRKQSNAGRPPSTSSKISHTAKSPLGSQQKLPPTNTRRKSSIKQTSQPSLTLRSKASSPPSPMRKVSSTVPPSPSKTFDPYRPQTDQSSSVIGQKSGSALPTSHRLASSKPKSLPPMSKKAEPPKQSLVIFRASSQSPQHDSNLDTTTREESPCSTKSAPNSSPTTTKHITLGQKTDLTSTSFKSAPNPTPNRLKPKDNVPPKSGIPQTRDPKQASPLPHDTRISIQGEIVTAKHSPDLGMALSIRKSPTPLPRIMSQSRASTPGSSTQSTQAAILRTLQTSMSAPSTSGRNSSSASNSVSTTESGATNGVSKDLHVSLGAAMHVARAVGKAKSLKNQKSKACVVS